MFDRWLPNDDSVTCVLLRHRKHVPCFYRVIETRVEVWENEKCRGNTLFSFGSCFHGFLEFWNHNPVDHSWSECKIKTTAFLKTTMWFLIRFLIKWQWKVIFWLNVTSFLRESYLLSVFDITTTIDLKVAKTAEVTPSICKPVDMGGL